MKLLLPFRKAIPFCGYVWLGHSVDDTRNFPSRFGKFPSEASGPRALVQVQAQLRRLASWSFVESVVDSWPIGFPPKHPWSYKKMSCVHQGFCCVVRWKNMKKHQNQKNNVKVMDDPGPEEWTLRKSHFEAVGRLWNSSLMSCPTKNQVFKIQLFHSNSMDLDTFSMQCRLFLDISYHWKKNNPRVDSRFRKKIFPMKWILWMWSLESYGLPW